MTALEVPDGIVFSHQPGGIVVHVAAATYPASTRALLDEALRRCPPGHRDALLEARHYLYPGPEAQ